MKDLLRQVGQHSLFLSTKWRKLCSQCLSPFFCENDKHAYVDLHVCIPMGGTAHAPSTPRLLIWSTVYYNSCLALVWLLHRRKSEQLCMSIENFLLLIQIDSNRTSLCQTGCLSFHLLISMLMWVVLLKVLIRMKCCISKKKSIHRNGSKLVCSTYLYHGTQPTSLICT